MNTSAWYYADRQHQQHGPVDAAVVADLFRQGRLGADSLVWQEGLPDWQPLSKHYEALGLGAADTDPGFLRVPAMPPPAPRESLATHAVDATSAAVVHAGFARRFAAYVIDSLILSFGFYAVLIVLVIVVMAAGGSSAFDGKEPPGWLVGGYLLAGLGYYVAAAFYYALQESGPHQATLGKRALGIKVTDSFGRRLDFGQALLRWFAAITSYLTLYVGFLMAAFTERKQALHDLIVGSFVVDRWAYTDAPEKQAAGSSGCLVVGVVAAVLFMLLFFVGILAAIAIPAYQDYTTRARVHEAFAAAAPAKVQLQEFVANTDRCPRDADELGLSSTGSPYLRGIDAGEWDGRCSLQLELAGFEGAYELEGKQVWLEAAEDGQWHCSSNAPAKYLPSYCR